LYTILTMNQLNNDGFFDLANLDQIEDEETGEQYLKQTIGSLRQNSFHKLADRLAADLEELRQ
jgi:hypothetical protein